VTSLLLCPLVRGVRYAHLPLPPCIQFYPTDIVNPVRTLCCPVVPGRCRTLCSMYGPFTSLQHTDTTYHNILHDVGALQRHVVKRFELAYSAGRGVVPVLHCWIPTVNNRSDVIPTALLSRRGRRDGGDFSPTIFGFKTGNSRTNGQAGASPPGYWAGRRLDASPSAHAFALLSMLAFYENTTIMFLYSPPYAAEAATYVCLLPAGAFCPLTWPAGRAFGFAPPCWHLTAGSGQGYSMEPIILPRQTGMA